MLDMMTSDSAKESCELHEVAGDRREESVVSDEDGGLCFHSNLEGICRVCCDLRESNGCIGSRRDVVLACWLDTESIILESGLYANTITFWWST